MHRQKILFIYSVFTREEDSLMVAPNQLWVISFQNLIMALIQEILIVLENLGFDRKGIIYVAEDNDPRYAYEI